VELPNKFACYWDESGTDPGVETKSKADTPLLGVGGYLAHVDEWKQFEVEWSSVLRSKHLARFHMTEFANLKDPYRNWNDSEREEFIQSLIQVICRYVRAYAVFAVETDAYMEAVKAKNILNKDIIRAYHICARKCIEWVSTAAGIAKHKCEVLHVFDQGSPAWVTFESSFTPEIRGSYNILQPVAKRNTDVAPLQAADMLVHQVVRNYSLSAALIPPANRRLYSVNLICGKGGVTRYIGEKDLRQLYQQEVMADELRLRGYDVRKVINFQRVTRQQRIFAEELFADAAAK